MTLTTSESDNNNTQSMDSAISITSTTSATPIIPVAATAVKNESLPTSEMTLLAKLEAANKLIESDAKSLNSLQSSAHSRKSSDTSQISLNSGIF
jgi:ecotropic viral integration site 5 protein